MAGKRKKKEKQNTSKKIRQKVQKQLKLQALLEEFKFQIEDYTSDMLHGAGVSSATICTRYSLELKNIPQKFQNFTLVEFEEIQKKTTPDRKPHATSALSSYMSRIKSLSEQRTLSTIRKKNPRAIVGKAIGKSNNSASTSKNLSSGGKSFGQPNRKPLGTVQDTVTPLTSRKHSTTPVAKNTLLPRHKKQTLLRHHSLTVTPKFDPRTPQSSLILRKPKFGEIIMSLSGSPLQNSEVTPELENPAPFLSLGGGKVLNIAENQPLNSFDTLQMDERTRALIMNVQQKLAGILKK